MDPLTLALIGGGLLQGIGGIFGASSADRAARRNQQMMQQRYNQLLGFIQPMLQENQMPGEGEQFLLDMLNGGGVFNNQAFNTGQDALMQMLRSDPISTTELFEAWEPIEQRALDEALAGAWAGAPGLGTRFGSATRREEGRVRGEAAENASSRRAQMTMDVEKQNADLQAMAAQLLANLGLAQGQSTLGAAQGLAGIEANRGNQAAQLLSILAGLSPAAHQPSQIPGAVGDIGQLMAFLPMFLQMMRPPATA